MKYNSIIIIQIFVSFFIMFSTANMMKKREATDAKEAREIATKFIQQIKENQASQVIFLCRLKFNDPMTMDNLYEFVLYNTDGSWEEKALIAQNLIKAFFLSTEKETSDPFWQKHPLVWQQQVESMLAEMLNHLSPQKKLES